MKRRIERDMMKLPRRNFLHLAVGAAALPAASRIAGRKPIRRGRCGLLLLSPPAGATDIIARLIAQWLSERIGQQFIVENRPGAGGNIGTEAVVNSPLTATRCFFQVRANAIHATLYDKLNYNFIRDIAPVAHLAVALRVGGASVRSCKVDPRVHRLRQGQSRQDQYGVGRHRKYASCDRRTVQDDGRLDMVHVPYRGGGPAHDRSAGRPGSGHCSTTFPAQSNTSGLASCVPLAVTTAARSEALPDIPTVADFVPGYEASAWYGVGAPRNTPVRDHRQAQQRDQCGPRRSQDQGAACRAGRDGACAARQPTSGSSSPTKPRNGARW